MKPRRFIEYYIVKISYESYLGKMPVYNALLTAENYYHVFNRAVGNEKLFLTDENYNYFLSKLKQYLLPIADIFCYSLLTNHFHIFLRFKNAAIISANYKNKNKKVVTSEQIPDYLVEELGNFFNAYTKAFNKMYNRKGRLFMESFKRREITDCKYYTAIIHYIHANPVHHGMCSKIEEWAQSSYHAILKDDNEWLQCKEILLWFGGTEEFRKFHAQPINRKFV